MTDIETAKIALSIIRSLKGESVLDGMGVLMTAMTMLMVQSVHPNGPVTDRDIQTLDEIADKIIETIKKGFRERLQPRRPS